VYEGTDGDSYVSMDQGSGNAPIPASTVLSDENPGQGEN
jgi:hypothetical protein